MPALKNQHKIFIVERLARFDSPSEVQEAVKEEFGLDLSTSQLAFYDPTTASGAELAKKWKALFKETRERFIDDTSDIAVSHKSFRLRRLESMARAAEKRGNVKLAAQLYEQIAKECGDAYTNRREITGKGGTPLTPPDTQFTVQVLKSAGE
jgi:hypothetical protein